MMQLRLQTSVGLALICGVLGCRSINDPPDFATEYQPFVQQIEYPEACMSMPQVDPASLTAPPTLSNYEQLAPWNMTLSQAIEIALQHSDVMRDIGGRVVTAPSGVSTSYDPALQETDPLSGVEAALSDFDAQLATSLTFNRNENKFNNLFFGGGASSVASNNAQFNAGITKTAATGTLYGFRNISNYERNNVPLTVNRFSSVYNTLFQAEVRHPLMQGAGVEFNRIAGPGGIPGIYNGVLVARINNDITLAQFEASVRDLCLSVEQTYWRLHQAYRELDTRQRSRHAAGLIWRNQKQRYENGGGLPPNVTRQDDVAQARQRYFTYQSQVENALSGGPAIVGVFSYERQLRRLLGLPPADGKMILPSTPATTVEVLYDWNGAVTEALTRRVELRQQRWLVRRRELELTAARNYAKARLDFVGQYSWKGFGDDLLGSRGLPEGSAFADLFSGQLQDWRLGLELTTPIGNRIGQLAVRNAQLQVARDRAIQRDQELQVSHELAAALAEKERALANMRSTLNSRLAAQEQVRLVGERVSAGRDRLFFVLEAQQRLADAESLMHRAVADYNLALLDVEYRRGTLLSYMEVSLTEGPWCGPAHRSASKQARAFRPKRQVKIHPDQTPVSSGVYDQLPWLEAFRHPLESEEQPVFDSRPIGSGVASDDPSVAEGELPERQ